MSNSLQVDNCLEKIRNLKFLRSNWNPTRWTTFVARVLVEKIVPPVKTSAGISLPKSTSNEYDEEDGLEDDEDR
ncbi:hypothetical protein V2J09_020989 [Rumex salicifolius]